MLDLPDVISLPKTLVLWALRALWWLGWEFGVQIVGRSVGWSFCRAITFGHFPAEQLSELEESNPFIAFFTELLGLALIAFAIYLPSQSGPTP